jgi:hypothetical protein
MERHNLYIKGAADFLGQVEIGRDMLTTLTIEFPKLIYQCSTDHAHPCNDIPVFDLKRAVGSDLFMRFRNCFNPYIDMVEYAGGWLMNDVDFLGEKITDDVIEKFNEALEGIVEPGHSSEDMRDVLLQRTQTFHHVQLASQLLHDSNETVEFYECDCRGYFYW